MLDRQRKKSDFLSLAKNKDKVTNESEEQLLIADSKKSYFTLNQYNAMNKRINKMLSRLKD